MLHGDPGYENGSGPMSSTVDLYSTLECNRVGSGLTLATGRMEPSQVVLSTEKLPRDPKLPRVLRFLSVYKSEERKVNLSFSVGSWYF